MGVEELQRVAFALALVLGLLLASAALLRRWRGVVPFQSAKELEVVSTTYLGPKERLVVVRIRGEEWLLGVSTQQISKLGELSPQPKEEALGHVI